MPLSATKRTVMKMATKRVNNRSRANAVQSQRFDENNRLEIIDPNQQIRPECPRPPPSHPMRPRDEIVNRIGVVLIKCNDEYVLHLFNLDATSAGKVWNPL